jgi:hypothetical protein
MYIVNLIVGKQLLVNLESKLLTSILCERK